MHFTYFILKQSLRYNPIVSGYIPLLQMVELQLGMSEGRKFHLEHPVVVLPLKKSSQLPFKIVFEFLSSLVSASWSMALPAWSSHPIRYA